MKGISRRNRNAWALCWLSTLILGTILAVQVGSHLMTTGFLDVAWKRPFDATIWASSDARDNRRWEMVDDLQSQYLKPGVSRGTVRKLLGFEFSGEQSPRFSYPIGNDLGDTIDLVIDFDKAGRLLRSDLQFN